MVRWWQVINVDKREASKHVWGEIGAWFFYPHEQLLHHISFPCLPKEVDEWLEEGNTAVQRGPFSQVPVEILDLIFEELRELHEVIHLSITCKPLLAAGKRHILRATKDHYAPWVGCRLISLDDETHRLDDLPPHLLSDAERKEIETTEVPHEYWEHERNLSNFSNEFYRRVFHMEWRTRRINSAARLTHELHCWRLLSENALNDAAARDVKMFATLYGDGRSATYPDGVRVLCNLSKGEYVRADGLTVPSYANLAHALLARVCWSSSPEIGMVCADEFKPQLMAGAWAGDRFCITSLDLLPEHEAGGEWKDTTREVDELLTHIWENNNRRWIVYRKV